MNRYVYANLYIHIHIHIYIYICMYVFLVLPESCVKPAYAERANCPRSSLFRVSGFGRMLHPNYTQSKAGLGI